MHFWKQAKLQKKRTGEDPSEEEGNQNTEFVAEMLEALWHAGKLFLFEIQGPGRL